MAWQSLGKRMRAINLLREPGADARVAVGARGTGCDWNFLENILELLNRWRPRWVQLDQRRLGILTVLVPPFPLATSTVHYVIIGAARGWPHWSGGTLHRHVKHALRHRDGPGRRNAELGNGNRRNNDYQ